MKLALKNIIALILTLLTVQVYSQVNVTDFKVQESYLKDGKILIKHATANTEIKIDVQFSTFRDNYGNPKPGNILTRLGTGNSSGQIIFLSPEQEVKSSEFIRDIFITKTYTISIEKSKLTGNNIDLLTRQGNFSLWGGFTAKSYKYIIEERPVVKPTIYYNTLVSVNFTKNDCPPGSDAPNTAYYVAAGKYSSTISQADADAKAQAEIMASGQNKANLEQTCVDFGNVKTPSGTWEINYSDYITDVKWNQLKFSGTNVKIQLYSSDGLTVVREIAANVPNTGVLKNVTVVPKDTWGSYFKIKVTSLDTGLGYFSNIFDARQD